MPQPDHVSPFKRLDGKPVFDEAWQAETLAMAQSLIDNGVINPKDWANALGAALSKLQINEASDTIENYYLAALNALEIVLQPEGVSKKDRDAQKNAWIEAYEITPHGQPVLLRPTSE